MTCLCLLKAAKWERWCAVCSAQCAPCSKSQTSASHLALGRTDIALGLNVLFATRLMKFGYNISSAISLKLLVKGWKSAILPSQLVGFRKTGRLGRRSRWGDAAETEPLPPDSDPSEKLWCQRWRLDSNVDASSQLRGTLHGHCWWKRRQTNCRSMITYKKYQILIISWIIWDQEIIWLGVDKTAYKRNQSIIPHIASSWELVHQSFWASIKVPIWQWPGYWWTEAVCARGLLPNWWNSSKFPSSADQDCT